MDMQAEAERKKRATILDSEGQQQSEINKANGFKQATVLRAEGEAEAIKVQNICFKKCTRGFGVDLRFLTSPCFAGPGARDR